MAAPDVCTTVPTEENMEINQAVTDQVQTDDIEIIDENPSEEERKLVINIKEVVLKRY